MTTQAITNETSRNFIKFISFRDIELWDVKRYSSEKIISKYPIVKLGTLIKEESHRVKLNDFPDKELKPLDWIVASMHIHVINPSTVENISKAYINLAKNPYVDVIGHCCSPRFVFDYERVLKVFKEYNKFVEINESSILNKSGTKENYVEVIRLCKKLEVPVIVNSDAHICMQVGVVPTSEQMLADQDFPKDLVINSDWDKLRDYIVAKRGNIFE